VTLEDANQQKMAEILKHSFSLMIVDGILLPETPSALTTPWQSTLYV